MAAGARATGLGGRAPGTPSHVGPRGTSRRSVPRGWPPEGGVEPSAVVEALCPPALSSSRAGCQRLPPHRTIPTSAPWRGWPPRLERLQPLRPAIRGKGLPRAGEGERDRDLRRGGGGGPAGPPRCGLGKATGPSQRAGPTGHSRPLRGRRAGGLDRARCPPGPETGAPSSAWPEARWEAQAPRAGGGAGRLLPDRALPARRLGQTWSWRSWPAAPRRYSTVMPT